MLVPVSRMVNLASVELIRGLMQQIHKCDMERVLNKSLLGVD